jgi:hypothetical protein
MGRENNARNKWLSEHDTNGLTCYFCGEPITQINAHRGESYKDLLVLHHLNEDIRFEDSDAYLSYNEVVPCHCCCHRKHHFKKDALGHWQTSNKSRPDPLTRGIKNGDQHKGKHWYTDGSKNISAFECPDGFTPGKTVSKETREKISISGLKAAALLTKEERSKRFGHSSAESFKKGWITRRRNNELRQQNKRV